MAYNPHYVHEGTLSKAVNNLKYLGHRATTVNGKVGESFGSAVGGGLRKQMNMDRDNKRKAAEFAAAQQAREAMYAPTDEDVEFIKGNSPMSPERGPGYERARVAAGEMVPGGEDAMELARIHDELQAQEAAKHARIGGHYTPEGLETEAREAELNGRDRLRMKSMLGQQFRMPDYGIGGAPSRFGDAYGYGD